MRNGKSALSLVSTSGSPIPAFAPPRLPARRVSGRHPRAPWSARVGGNTRGRPRRGCAERARGALAAHLRSLVRAEARPALEICKSPGRTTSVAAPRIHETSSPADPYRRSAIGRPCTVANRAMRVSWATRFDGVCDSACRRAVRKAGQAATPWREPRLLAARLVRPWVPGAIPNVAQWPSPVIAAAMDRSPRRGAPDYCLDAIVRRGVASRGAARMRLPRWGPTQRSRGEYRAELSGFQPRG